MRHGISGRKLNRTSSHRLAMFRNMVTSLLEHERIYTTIPKAKELRRWADWMITLGKRGDLHARRQVLTVVHSKDVLHKLFAEIAPRFQDRQGGYTRIVKAGFRRGDAAPMCLIELLSESTKPISKPAKPGKVETVATATPVSTKKEAVAPTGQISDSEGPVSDPDSADR